MNPVELIGIDSFGQKDDIRNGKCDDDPEAGRNILNGENGNDICFYVIPVHTGIEQQKKQQGNRNNDKGQFNENGKKGQDKN